MTEKKVVTFILLALFLLFNSCQKGPERDFKVYRLIDHLKEENILSSPLIPASPLTDLEARKFYPLNFRPLLDLGIGEDPYGIKMKLYLGGVDFNVIFAPPRSEFSYTLSLPQRAVLDFGIGIVRDENSERLILDKEKGVNFLITLEHKGRKKTIFQNYVNLPSGQEEDVFFLFRHKIELPRLAKEAQLSLLTQGEKGVFSFWYNPVVYRPPEERKNVILICLDTLRADHLGCYGYPRKTSPNIDSLTTDSALFLNTYASSPWTLPSHVSLFTSLSGVQHQVYYHDEKMDPSLVTLAEILRQHYFFCPAFTGGGFVNPEYGFSKGFDVYYTGEGGVYYHNSAQLVYQIVSQWLERNGDKNFFMFIHTYQPHDPYACPYPYKTMFLDDKPKWRQINLAGYLGEKRGIFRELPEKERQNIIGLYDGEVRYADERLIKPLLEKLKEMNLYDQTMVIFTSDHGEEFYDHRSWLHGHNLYDESLKVPLIIKFPESKFAGKRIETLVRLIDLMPTILEDLGIDFSDYDFDGASLIPLLKNEDAEDRVFLADVGNNVLDSRVPQKITMNWGRYKLILNREFSKEDLRFFLSPPPSIPSMELYDLAQDPYEKRNIASEKNDLVAQLTKKIEEIYRKARKRKEEKIKIDEELKKELKALGYIR